MATIKQRYAPDIKNYKYLIHPLKKNVKITEGFLYTQDERNIHGHYFHKGIDYSSGWKTPVYAAASGYAVAGYHRFPHLDENNIPILLDDKPISGGLGYFVQIYHPYKISRVKGGRITQYAHLSKFAKGIRAKTHRPLKIDYKKAVERKNSERRKYRKSEKELKNDIKKARKLVWRYPWISRLYGYSFSNNISKKESYLYSPKELKQLYEKGSRYVKWVEQGELIGYTGLSGVIHGRLKYRENRRKPNVRKFKTWDEPHLHFEEATRDWESGEEILHRDPYGIYLSKEHYQNLKFDTLFKDLEKKFSM